MHSNTYQTIVTGIMIVKNQDNKYLFLKRSKQESYGAGLWDFPGGAKEFLETPEQGAVRECLEESGVAVNSVELIWHLVTRGIMDPTQEFVSFFFLGLADNDEIQLSHEHDDYKWLTLEEANDLETVEWMQIFFKELEQDKIKL